MTAERIQLRIRETLARQRKLVSALLRLREQLEGSLFVRYGECGKAECACHTEGRRHGPYYVLSTRTGGRGSFTYLDAPTARQAKQKVARHRAFRAGLKELQLVNASLVALLRRYQQAQLRRTGRRVGLPAPAKSA
jgi:predicted RNA-binding protein YlxR (DUF448 family)